MPHYTGPREIKVVYHIKKENKDYDMIEEDDITVGEFTARVQTEHRIAGLPTLWYKGEKLTHKNETLAKILEPGHKIYFEFDVSQSFACGGMALGAEAESTSGLAVAEGGFATGGSAYKDLDGRSCLRGGRGAGGDGQGMGGRAGLAYGGIASAVESTVWAGRATAGNFHLTNQ